MVRTMPLIYLAPGLVWPEIAACDGANHADAPATLEHKPVASAAGFIVDRTAEQGRKAIHNDCLSGSVLKFDRDA
jgi:hypothetical protein